MNYLRTRCAAVFVVATSLVPLGRAANTDVTAGATENFTLLSNPSVGSVQITTSDRTPSTGSGPYSGTASITFTFAAAGAYLPAVPPIGPMSYSNLTVANGKVTGAKFTATTAQTIQNAFGTGINFVIAQGSTLTLTGPSPMKLAFTGTASLTLPFQIPGGGNAVKASLTGFSIDSNGGASANATLSLTNGIQLPGVKITTGTFTLALTVANGSTNVSWTCPTAKVAISLPEVTTNDDQPIILDASSLSFDANGLLSFANATLPTGPPLTVSLAAPSNFTLSLASATVSMTGSTLKSASFAGSMTLPPMFSSTDKTTGTASPVTISDIAIKFDPTSGLTVSAGSTAPIDVWWNGFHLNIGGKSQSAHPLFILDLSNKIAVPGEVGENGGPLPASWQGLFIASATLNLPADAFGPNASVGVQNLTLDSGGISGKFTATTPELKNFTVPGLSFIGAVTVSSLAVTLIDSSIADFEVGANITPTGGTPIDLKINSTESGTLSYTLDSGSVSWSSLGVTMNIDQGTFTLDPKTKQFALDLTGSIVITGGGDLKFLKGTVFAVKDVKLSNGALTVAGATLDLPHPASVSCGPVNLVLNAIGFGTTAGKMTIMLTGDVAITELPINGQIGFQGLTISSGPNGPSVAWGGISFSAGISGLATITGSIDHTKFLPTAAEITAQPAWKGKPAVDVYNGSASISLDCFGPSASVGAQLTFMVAPTGWYVVGSATFPGIELGPTGLSLFGLEGGFGHDVESDTGDPTGIPGQDYQLIPFAPGQSGDTWMFMAGARIGTSDEFTAWGDLVLSILFGSELLIDLHGEAWLMTSAASAPPMGQTNGFGKDRNVTIDINYNGQTQTFQASGDANINLPGGSVPGLQALGSVDLTVQPSGSTFNLGGPINYTPGGAPPQISNPITVKVLGLTGAQSGVVAAYTPQPPSASFTVASVIGPSFSGSAGPFSVSGGYTLWFWANGQISTQGFSLGVYAGVDASLNFSVSVWGVGLSVGLGVSGSVGGTIQSSNPVISIGGNVSAYVNLGPFHESVGVGFHYP